MIRRIWRMAGLKLLPLLLVMCTGAYVAGTHFNAHHMTAKAVILSTVGVLAYISAAFSFLHVLTSAFYKSIVHRVGVRRAATVRFFLRVAGYLIIMLGLLTILHIPIAKILVGSALIGIILSVAAQQSLANFFASVVIILDRPFVVGQEITIVSGGLGGEYDGIVIDINFSHTMLKLADGSIVRLPNAPLLSGSAVIERPKKSSKKESHKTARKK